MAGGSDSSRLALCGEPAGSGVVIALIVNERSVKQGGGLHIVPAPSASRTG